MALGKAVVQRGAGAWLVSRRDRRERSAALTDLIAVGFPDLLHRRKLERLDLSPLRGMQLIACFHDQQQVTGLDRLGSGVRIEYF